MENWDEFLADPEVISILESIHESLCKRESKYFPNSESIFEMFKLLNPSDIRVVLIGQSPYSNYCPITKKPYARGIAFCPSNEVRTVPKSAQIIMQESGNKGECRNAFESWINQGVFLTNLSLTVGNDGPYYIRDHIVMWEEFTRKFVRYIDSVDIIYGLIGTESWRLSECIKNGKVIKTYHPVSRDTTKSFIGSKIFDKINEDFVINGLDKIKWKV